ncbi:MAG TPA: HAMP domain-containing sensor histidine kinase [Lachnospiraceae bacterium]|nr:HAMP domain-containing sensor histidine kinase [Lachnospiraceae bacterium]
MGEIIAIIILILIAGFYMLRFYFLKANIRKATRQLKEIAKDPEANQILLISYPDKEAEYFLEVMNEYITLTRKNKIRFDRREKELRAQIESISHDLRTPLTAIIGYLELLDLNSIGEENQEMIDAVGKKARTLQSLIGNFYDLSRLEMDDYHLQMEKMDLVRFTKETTLLSYRSFEQRGLSVELHLEEEYYISADVGAMERIFSNMLQNALRYAKSYLHITVTRTGNTIHLTFVNDCESLRPEDATHIFERFYVNEKSRTSQSTGIGLTINKLLAEAMNATVEAGMSGNELSITYQFRETF